VLGALTVFRYGRGRLPRRVVNRERAIVCHITTSVLVAIGWVPLGALIWFILNWGSSAESQTAVATGSVLFLFAQIVGNPVIGAMFDRKFGTTSGLMLAIGRSLLAAAILAIVLFFVMLLFIGATS